MKEILTLTVKALMTSGRKFSNRERLTMVLCLLVFLSASYMIYDETIIYALLGNDTNKAPSIGSIQTAQQDVRYKNSTRNSWRSAGAQQKITAGSTVYSGQKSSAQIQLKNGSGLVLGEDSLVSFKNYKGEQISELKKGNYSLFLKGKTKFLINGKLVTMDSQKAHVQIYMGQNSKPQIKLISGKSVIKTADGNQRKMQVEKVVSFENDKKPILKKKIPRYFTLYDLYATKNGRLLRKPERQAIGKVFLTSKPPTLRAENSFVSLGDKTIQLRLPEGQYLNYIIESSSTPTFEPENTNIAWLSKPAYDHPVPEEETLFVRARGVNHRQELSEFGNRETITIDHPQRILSQLVPRNVHLRRPAQEMPKPPAIPKKRIRRGVSSLNQVSSKTYINWKYLDTKVQVEAGFFNLRSSSPAGVQRNLSSMTMLGVRSQVWAGRHGGELLIKSKVQANNALGEDVSPLFVEGRYHYRFRIPLRGDSVITDLQFTSYLGLEYYRNRNTIVANTGYEIIKLGTLLAIPIGQRWDIGGEASYGMAFDSSTKYEIGGNLSYYFSSNWSMGLQYKVHFFEAGSLDTTPTSLPYREAYDETYTSLKYYF